MSAAPFDHPFLKDLLGDEEVAAFFTGNADIAAMLAVEAALAKAEAAEGLIPQAAAKRIGEVCATFEPDMERLRAGTRRDGVVVPDLVRQLREAVGEFGSHLHHGATSQDIVDTSLVLRLKPVLAILERRMGGLIAGFDGLEERDGSRPLMGHTRMQAALPITLRDKIRNWRQPLVHAQERIRALNPSLLVVQLGGAVGTRHDLSRRGENVAARMATLLGLNPAPVWHTQRDTLALFASLLSILTGALGKFGQDVALMAQADDVKLAGGGTSSAMPHKSNPVSAEILVALARFNAGLLGTFHQALVHENERSGAAWTLEWLTLPQMVMAAGASLLHADALVGQLEFPGRAAIAAPAPPA